MGSLTRSTIKHTRTTQYKLGLAVFIYRALGEPPAYEEKIRDILHILSEAQDPESGGIFTSYKVVGGKLVFSKNVSDVNVETSSVIVLALYSNLPEEVGLRKHNNQLLTTPYLLILLVSTIAVLATSIAVKLKAFK